MRRLENTPKSGKHNETMRLEDLNQVLKSGTKPPRTLRHPSTFCKHQGRRPAKNISNSKKRSLHHDVRHGIRIVPHCNHVFSDHLAAPWDENCRKQSVEAIGLDRQHPSLVGRHADTISNDVCLQNTLIRMWSVSTKNCVSKNVNFLNLKK